MITSEIPKFTGKAKHRKLKIYNLIKKYGALNHVQLYDLLNQDSKIGVTTWELSSTMASMKKYVKQIGFIDNQGSNVGGRVRVIIWGLK